MYTVVRIEFEGEVLYDGPEIDNEDGLPILQAYAKGDRSRLSEVCCGAVGIKPNGEPFRFWRNYRD